LTISLFLLARSIRAFDSPFFDASQTSKTRSGHSDPEGETTAKSLKELQYNVEDVKVGKTYEIILNAKSKKTLKDKLTKCAKDYSQTQPKTTLSQ